MKNSRSIIVGISGLILNKNEISILKRYLPLGIILFSRNIKDKFQLVQLVNQIKGIVGNNLLILIDKEGKIYDTFSSFTNPLSKKITNKIEKILN